MLRENGGEYFSSTKKLTKPICANSDIEVPASWAISDTGELVGAGHLSL